MRRVESGQTTSLGEPLKRLLLSLALVLSTAGCAATGTAQESPSAAATMAPGGYEFVTDSGAKGVVTVPATAGGTTVTVSVDNTAGAEPVPVSGVALYGTAGKEILFTNPADPTVPAGDRGEFVFTGEEVPAAFYGVSVYQPKGVSLDATPVK